MYTEIDRCRISGSQNLIQVLSLGQLCLTGVFPRSIDGRVSKGPLDLVWCPDSGLLQLRQSYSLGEMYGDNYGYRSGLNASMVRHLTNKVRFLEGLLHLTDRDTVLDIGSNDGTLLKAYSGAHQKVGIDPTGAKFREYYAADTLVIPEFFSKEAVELACPGIEAKIITSIAMFYDLESPMGFVNDIAAVLAEDGVWHFEQSYMPSMLRTTAYDAVCHEHLEFYSLTVVANLLEKCGLRIIDVQMNAVNGGSFAVTACKRDAPFATNKPVIEWLLAQERAMGLDTPAPYRQFEERVFRHRNDLARLVRALTASGKTVFGYGASTKGNVLLQFCNLSVEEIPYIADVNEEKFGCVTPGTHIPIVSEHEAHQREPDYFLVLPWHFKPSILEREAAFLARGGKMIFPLPEIEIV